MVKKINSKVVRRISNKERHIRVNWEKSPENPECMRYHIAVVDDKNRRQTLLKIIEPFFEWGNVIPIREKIEGKVEGTRLKYLFESYDINQKPTIANLTGLGKPVKRDYDLTERIKSGCSIEEYVARIYSKVA